MMPIETVSMTPVETVSMMPVETVPSVTKVFLVPSFVCCVGDFYIELFL